MKKNILLAVCAAVVAQGLCAEAALPVKVGQEGLDGYSVLMCAIGFDGQVSECAEKSVPLASNYKLKSIKIPNLKYDKIYGYELALRDEAGKIVGRVKQVPQGTKVVFGIAAGRYYADCMELTSVRQDIANN
jgi:hypothetical protein